MSFLKSVTKGRVNKPYCVLIYGKEGVGKTSFAAGAPNPIAITPGTGTDNIDVARGRAPRSYEELKNALQELRDGDHDFQTVIIDDVDWYENHVWTQVIKEDKRGAKSIVTAGGGYGAGFAEAAVKWVEVIDLLEELREKRKMHIFVTAHCEARNFTDPRHHETYQTYDLKLHKKASEKFKEWVDAVLFATTDDDVATLDDKVKAFSMSEENIIHTKSSPGWTAKNRYGLPPKLPLRFSAFDDAVKASKNDDVSAILGDIDLLLPKVTDSELRAKVTDFIEKAGRDLVRLKLGLNRLKEITAESEQIHE